MTTPAALTEHMLPSCSRTGSTGFVAGVETCVWWQCRLLACLQQARLCTCAKCKHGICKLIKPPRLTFWVQLRSDEALKQTNSNASAGESSDKGADLHFSTERCLTLCFFQRTEQRSCRKKKRNDMKYNISEVFVWPDRGWSLTMWSNSD